MARRDRIGVVGVAEWDDKAGHWSVTLGDTEGLGVSDYTATCLYKTNVGKTTVRLASDTLGVPAHCVKLVRVEYR